MIRLLCSPKKTTALFLAACFLLQAIHPPLVYALTSGPTQPEVQSFQPAGTTDMVDVFSGDFSYNIPLFELPGPNGGYPFNLSYQSSIGMDQEASWTGLGWNLQPGSIGRQMRGLPDEFKGDALYTKMSIAPSVTVGLGAGVQIEALGKDFSLGAGFSVSQNHYKGFGYSLDASLGFQKTVSGMTGGLGVNLGLDSKEGVNVNPSLSLSGKLGEFGLGAGYNSKEGLHNVSLSHQYGGRSEKYKDKKSDKERTWRSGGFASSATLSLTHPGYTPQLSMPMSNLNLAATFKAGAAWWGIFGAPYVRGFYNEQTLQNDKKRVRAPGYGYLHYQDVSGANVLMDMNREKDGLITKESPNLAIPSQTYDIYSATGQGMSAMYRPMRNDYGILRDPEVSSETAGGSVGVDVAPAASHVGVNLSINYTQSTSGGWTESNGLAEKARFGQRKVNDAFEPWYYKVHGEANSEKTAVLNTVGGTDAVRVQLTGSNSHARAAGVLEKNRTDSQPAPDAHFNHPERKPRQQVMQPITNEQLLSGGTEALALFRLKYRDHTGAELPYVRTGWPKHHLAGFTALNAEGLRYTYGIPAYNLYQEEASFSVRKQPGQVARVHAGPDNPQGDPAYAHNNTDQFLKRTEIPAYAHAYLLTSVVGPDYVDVTGDGVSTDDLGYWVKFTYQKTTTDTDRYKWRDPFSQAHYQEGWKTDPRDDKGSFTYGEKEMWYLARAETKSHIADFQISPRQDGMGVLRKLQDTDTRGKAVYHLDGIKLYTRSAGSGHPIKSVKLEYDYSLCPGVYNSNAGSGKLTLKKVWFEYGSSRGSLNPYVFTYQAYDMHAYDRWGNFKPYPAGNYQYNHDFPYTEQDPLKKEDIGAQAASWSLRQIDLPSGGQILVDFEADDYGYVQHEVATQMMKIVDPYQPSSTLNGAPTFAVQPGNLKVRFGLEKNIDGSQAVNAPAEVLKYLDQQRKQLYFKLKVNLRSPGEDFYEYVSGYADIDFGQPMGLEKNAAGNYAYGYFYVKPEQGFHPFAMRAWQHLRTNQPELANSGRKLSPASNTDDRVSQIKSLGSIVTQVRQMFEGFYNYCNGKGWGKQVVAGESWIKLKSPDRMKFGGGLRVRQITLKDNWAEDREGVYGQVYEYTTEEDGNPISSGVASYEPLIGGDENPLRYAKKYVQSVPLRSDNNLFFEYPINESYYPGAQVGYGKVTVTSLAAASLAGKVVKNTVPAGETTSIFPTGAGVSYGTTGATVHEFYTARDFPVITEETEKENKPYQVSVAIPFLGSISVSKLTTSQGYSILTNDMHGKPKKVSQYRQDPQGKIEPQPVSWVAYQYRSAPRLYGEKNVWSLQNTFKENGDGTLSLAQGADLTNSALVKYTLGQENEFFVDMRQYEDHTWQGGASFNIDILLIPIVFALVPIPIPMVWPTVGKSSNQLRSAVTNKVIFQSGILEKTEAYNEGSSITTQHLKWDKLTGAPVLTVVNNNFDAPVYRYSIPAYTQYQGMGAAYQNTGLTFSIAGVTRSPYRNDLYQFSPDANKVNLQPGDEWLLYPAGNGELANPVASGVYTGQENGIRLFHTGSVLTQTAYRCLIVRSGFRNQLGVMAGNITALQDPSVPGPAQTYSVTVPIPKTQ